MSSNMQIYTEYMTYCFKDTDELFLAMDMKTTNIHTTSIILKSYY